jgi:hypothetical protein
MAMRVCRIETTVSGDRTVIVKDMPFPPGERVEVVVRSHDPQNRGDYPLRGKPFRYIDPFEGVAENDWEAPR